MQNWTLTKLAGHCGARLSGGSLQELDAQTLDVVTGALFEHGVICLPDQHLTPEAHTHLARALGDIVINRFFTPVPDHPHIAEVRTKPDQGVVIGGTWHTDHSYDAEPAAISILSARELPPFGGDTHFASQSAALQVLSPGLREMLGAMWAWHSDASFAGSALEMNQDPDAYHGGVRQPVVIRHPVTGAAALYVNGDFTTHFDGWSVADSAPLLAHLYAVCTQPILTCRVAWRPGMVVLWDNRLVQHYATADYAGHARLMHRITVAGSTLAPWAEDISVLRGGK
ncbi:TauD/TfdA family dioxygenase [uncultured Tateyamaria sp.]|uniref:TauD/TfdA dioxygenase family protein n=1 Tax=uncultured Tateyamaria sp. TaxID=455651 RepID=UPI002608B1FA|nr:TauD/TfdA family dioxygenase [uncultured Tateyamaria sp.]